MLKKIIQIVAFVLAIVVLFILSENFFFRLDLTSEKRYTLSDNTKNLLGGLDQELNVKVFLDGDLNPGFLRLRKSVKEMLDEFDAYAGNEVKYQFINPSAASTNAEREKFYEELEKKGMRGVMVFDKDAEGESKQKIVFPWLEISYGDKSKCVNLLKNVPHKSGEENLNNSIETLEYELTDVLRIVTSKEISKVAFLEGHGELPEPYVYDFTKTLSRYYQVDRGVLSGQVDELKDYKAVIIAAPTEKFSEAEKFVLDQYIMNGGRVMWLVDGARISLDSLSTASQTIGVDNDVNLSDQLFKYGIRINSDLVQNVQCVLIPVNTARLGDTPKYEPMSWYYSPLLHTVPTHPISKNLAPVKAEFVSSLDFVNLEDKSIKKTPLLVTATGTHVQNVPSIVSMDIVNVEKNGYYFDKPSVMVGAALEGVFPSVFEHRMTPEGVKGSKEILVESRPTKMVVVTDGDLIRNDVQGSGNSANIVPLGYDQYMNQKFGNSEFLLNAVNYLTDDDGWLNLRCREVQLRLLNAPAVIGQSTFWKLVNLLMPILILGVFGLIFNFMRKRKYTK
jgi:ABC-2 type transport system permease protein